MGFIEDFIIDIKYFFSLLIIDIKYFFSLLINDIKYFFNGIVDLIVYEKDDYDRDGYDEYGEYLEESEFHEYQMNKDKHLKKIKRKIKKVSYGDLSKNEIKQLAEYIYLYEKNDCDEHWEVNEIITKEKKWGEFKKLRSKNNHGYAYSIKGIKPKYFAIVCDVLDIDASNGEPLIDYESY